MNENFEIQNSNFEKFGMELKDVRYKKILKHLENKSPGKILEIGCANGLFLKEMEKRGWTIKGIDITKELVEKCKKKGLNVKLHDAQQKFPFKEQFDIIVAGEVIEHMIDPDKFLKNCHDSLKSKGELIITTPNLAFILNRFLILFGKKPLFAYSDFHYKMFLLDDLKSKVSKYFKIKKIKGSHVLVSTRRSPLFIPFEIIADALPSISAHFILIASKR